MLSRVAESLYWMSRNVERAEMIARILDVNYNRSIDNTPFAGERTLRTWQSVMEVVGITIEAGLLAGTSISSNAFEYVTFSTENRTSILSCIRIARQNALNVRAELSTEVWEALNGLYLYCEAQSPASIVRFGPSSFLRSVRDRGLAFGGIVDATITHDEQWSFLQIGRYFERCAMTTRIIRAHTTEYTSGEWQRLLEMCCASEPFAKARRLSHDPGEALAFLLLQPTFPRSVRYCVHAIDRALHHVSGTPSGSYGNKAELGIGRLQAMLDFVQIDEILREGVPDFATRIGETLEQLGGAIESAYFPRIPTAA